MIKEKWSFSCCYEIVIFDFNIFFFYFFYLFLIRTFAIFKLCNIRVFSSFHELIFILFLCLLFKLTKKTKKVQKMGFNKPKLKNHNFVKKKIIMKAQRKKCICNWTILCLCFAACKLCRCAASRDPLSQKLCRTTNFDSSRWEGGGGA